MAPSRHRELQAVYAAESVSVIGDQLAKVALGVLVFERTGSAALTGAAYAATLLPPLVTGPLLAGWVGRYPRRPIMVAAGLLQATFVAMIAVPGIPLLAVAIGVAAVAAIANPYRAAQGAAVLDMTGPAENGRAQVQLTMIYQAGQLAGLALGGQLAVWLGASAAFGLDAVSFVAAALIIRVGVSARPVVTEPAAGPRPDNKPDNKKAWAAFRADPQIRLLWIYIGVYGLTYVPDALLVPMVQQAGAPNWTIGPLLACDCAGILIGSALVRRRPAAQKHALLAPLALASMVPLAAVALTPSIAVVGALLVASGAGASYMSCARARFGERTPARVRVAAGGLGQAAFRGSQGLAAIAGGLAAQRLGASLTITFAGVLGVAITGACLGPWRRALQGGDLG